MWSHPNSWSSSQRQAKQRLNAKLPISLLEGIQPRQPVHLQDICTSPNLIKGNAF
ncbi:unnamed protein product [Larinioides sclopetarius]|uniref:Uncharacterized protein n=1 Tax=Larinioides sclopetarius TaxID=280406 RepID=A0AAV1ZLL1_9ARAC